jgi:hypothetical protein
LRDRIVPDGLRRHCALVAIADDIRGFKRLSNLQYKGRKQVFHVPAGVKRVTITADWASGSINYGSGSGGGGGGYNGGGNGQCTYGGAGGPGGAKVGGTGGLGSGSDSDYDGYGGGGGGGGSSYVEKGATHVKNLQGAAPPGNGQIVISW